MCFSLLEPLPAGDGALGSIDAPADLSVRGFLVYLQRPVAHHHLHLQSIQILLLRLIRINLQIALLPDSRQNLLASNRQRSAEIHGMQALGRAQFVGVLKFGEDLGVIILGLGPSFL